MPVVFVLDVAEFKPVLDALAVNEDAEISGPSAGYWSVRSDGELALNRKRSGIGLALWYSSLAGGYIGDIAQFDRDDIRIRDCG